jgi:hypothetical protein
MRREVDPVIEQGSRFTALHNADSDDVSSII